MRSMTGFGQAAAEGERHRATVTLRGVNHRFLDVAVRLRDEHRAVERPLRDLVAARVARGRVEVVLEVEALGAGGTTMVVDRDLLRSIHDGLSDLAARGQVQSRLQFADLLRVPDLVRFGAAEVRVDEELVLAAAAAALEQFLHAKELEGASLRRALAERLDALEALWATMEERAGTLPAKMHGALRERIERLLAGVDLDPERLAQEAAVLVDRADVREELDRLRSHLQHYRQLLDGDGSLGKRLDFLSQEVFRELNTIASKCRDADLVRSVLDGKVLCEQLREQVQNVE